MPTTADILGQYLQGRQQKTGQDYQCTLHGIVSEVGNK
jgi:hypothetical protein